MALGSLAPAMAAEGNGQDTDLLPANEPVSKTLEKVKMKGIILDKKTMERLPGVSLMIMDTSEGTVTNVDVQGQTAWVNVDVTSKSLADQADAFAQVVESGASEAQDEEAYKAFLKQAYLESLDAASPRSHSLLVTVSRADDLPPPRWSRIPYFCV